MFADPKVPTPAELRTWAYSGKEAPREDFELWFADLAHLPVLIELVGDPDCPARRYMLGVLYYTVGICWRGDGRLREAVAVAKKGNNPWLAMWAARVSVVLDHPESFRVEDWCSPHGYLATP